MILALPIVFYLPLLFDYYFLIGYSLSLINLFIYNYKLDILGTNIIVNLLNLVVRSIVNYLEKIIYLITS